MISPPSHLAVTATLLILALCTGGLPAASTAEGDDALRALFIGNSLTAEGDVPARVAALFAAAGGPPLDAVRSTRGGETLEGHVRRTDRAAPLPALESSAWDLVVIQENGRRAAAERTPGLDPFMLRPARTLVEAAREAGARPILYMTWGYRGATGHLDRIRATHRRVAEELGVEVAPVGDAFALARREVPQIDLLQADGVHASAAGAHLAAAVIYTAVTSCRSPAASPAEVPDAATARLLADVAWRSVAAWAQPPGAIAARGAGIARRTSCAP